jgi:holo-[acyl-carrier protein] synthase
MTASRLRLSPLEAPSLAGPAAPGPAPAPAPESPVVGIGVDAVDVARFRRILVRRPGFAARYFTAGEQADARRSPDPTESLAARFAAKEAVMKALGSGLGTFSLRDVEVVRAPGGGPTSGAPSLRLADGAAALAERRQVARWHVSLTHTATVAVAMVVAEGGPGPGGH